MRICSLISLIILSLCVSCSFTSKRTEAPVAPVTPVTPNQNAVKAEPSTSQEIEQRIALAAPGQAPATEASNPPPSPSRAHHSASGATTKSVPPQQALKWLENGNKRFVKRQLRGDGQAKSDIVRLAKGQQPHTIMLSCSDSRVPPEIVFDQKLGELFVVRTAGEALDHNVVASIEYAVAHLGSKLIVVMGHTSCGAVKAALSTPEGGDAGSPSLNHLVQDLQPRLKAVSNRGKPADDVAAESWANAQGIVDELKRFSPILRSALEKGDLEIRAALYHLPTGQVKFN